MSVYKLTGYKNGLPQCSKTNFELVRCTDECYSYKLKNSFYVKDSSKFCSKNFLQRNKCNFCIFLFAEKYRRNLILIFYWTQIGDLRKIIFTSVTHIRVKHKVYNVSLLQIFSHIVFLYTEVCVNSFKKLSASIQQLFRFSIILNHTVMNNFHLIIINPIMFRFPHLTVEVPLL